jgi:hypothetical protein
MLKLIVTSAGGAQLVSLRGALACIKRGASKARRPVAIATVRDADHS